MTPMIDVVFLLLIFFVCTASFQIAEQILPSSILAAGTTEAPLTDPLDLPLDQIIVRTQMVGGRARWTINEQGYETLGQVEEVLRSVHAVEADLPLILHNEDDVPLGSVIDVYDLARIIGFEEIQFAASE